MPLPSVLDYLNQSKAAPGGPGAEDWTEEDERKFREWYAKHAKENDLKPDPDEAHQFYDYRAAYKAGVEPSFGPAPPAPEVGPPEPQHRHWPSEYKLEGHPNRFVEGIDTITGKPATPELIKANDEARRSALTPRAFRREPPPPSLPSVADFLDGKVQKPPRPEELTVSQMPGVIPQEEVYPVEEDTYPEAALKGVARGFRGIPRQALNTSLALGARDLPMNIGWSIEQAAEGLKDPRSIQQEGQYSTGKQFLTGVAEGIPQLVGVTALGGIGGAAAVASAATFAFTQEAGAAYEKALAEGATDEEAKSTAIKVGIINGALEYAPVLELYRRLGGKQAVTALRHVVLQTLEEGGTEGVQEVVGELTALATYANDKKISGAELTGLITDPGKRGQILMAMAVGGTLGAGTGTVTAPAAVRAYEREQAEAARQKEVQETAERLKATALGRAAEDIKVGQQGQELEEGAEQLLERDQATRDVTLEERERENLRAAVAKRQAEIDKEQGDFVVKQQSEAQARRALEQEAMFPAAPSRVQPTADVPVESLLAAEKARTAEQEAAAKRAKVEADYPLMPAAMRERIAPPTPPPEAPPTRPEPEVGPPLPPARTPDEIRAEADRRADEALVGPPAPTPEMAAAKQRTEWRQKFRDTFQLTDDEVATSEAIMEMKGIDPTTIDPGGELAAGTADLFQTTRYKRKGTPHDLPVGYVPHEFDEEKGHYAGASHIKTPEQLKAVQDEAERLAVKGAEGRHFYTKSKGFVGSRSESPESAHQLSQTISITSPRNNVRQNLVDAARARVQAFFGVPLEARDFAGIPKKLAAVYGGEPYEMGRKTYNFGENIAGDLDRFTGDIWQQRVYGYQPKWSEKEQKWVMPAPTDAEYDFMEHDARRIAKKMGWPVAEVQAAQWAAKKSEDEGDTVEVSAKDYEDYASDPSILAHVSYESKPGTSTNHLPEMYSAPDRMQEAFHLANRRAAEDNNGIDIALRRFNLLQASSLHGLGLYSPETGPRKGELLQSPGTQLRAVAPSKLGDTLTLDPATVMGFDAASSATAIAFYQDAVPWHAPTSGGKVRDARIADIRFARALSKAEQIDLVAKVKAELQKAGFKGWEISVPMPGPTGVRLLNLLGPKLGKRGKIVKGGLDGVQFAKVMRNASRSMGPDAEVVLSSGQLGRYFENNWGESANGEGHYQNGSSGRSDVQDTIRSYVAEVLPRAQRVAELAEEIYGWTPNRDLHPEHGWKPLRGDDAFDALVRDILQSGLQEPAAAPAEGQVAPASDTDTLYQEGPPLEFPKRGSAKRPLQSVGPEDLQQILRQAEAPKASALRKEIADIERTPGWRFNDDLRQLHEETRAELAELEQPEAAANQRVRDSNEEGLRSKLAKGRERLAAIEAKPSWRFDQTLREEHARVEKGIKLTQEMLDRGLYQGARGVAQFAEDGRVVLRGLTNPDVSTAIHELAHVARRQFGEQDRVRLERIYHVKDGKWNREQEESFADEVERYFMGLFHPPKLAKPLFERVRDTLRNLWGKVTGREEINQKINPEVRRFFEDKILQAAGKEKAAPTTAAPAAAAPAPATEPGAPRGPPEPTPSTRGSQPPSAAKSKLGLVAEQLPDQILDLMEPGTLRNHLRRYFGKYYTKESLTPKDAYALHENARSEFRAHLQEARNAATDWMRTWNKAGQMDADKTSLKKFLKGDQAALANISTPEGRAAAEVMRNGIDRMQELLLRSGAVPLDSSLQGTIERSIGTYLTTRYKAFTDPKTWNWETVQKKHPAILANARKWVLDELAAEGVYNPYPGQVDARLKMFFPEAGESAGQNPWALLDKVGKKDLSVFMHKQDMPEVLRQLLGEHDDPLTNFLQTYQHISQIVVNQKMLSDLAKVGEAQGWLVPEDRATDDMTVKIAPDTPSYSPVAGMLTTPEIADAWKRLTTPRQVKSAFARLYLRQLGRLRALKTVYNIPSTHVGNILGNYPLMLSNGNWGALSFGKNKQAWKVAWDSAFGDIRASDQATRDFAVKMTRLGVTDSGISSSDLREIMREGHNVGDVFTDPGRRKADQTIGILERVGQVYAAEDNGSKVLSYLMEYAKYKQVYPNMPEAQLEQRVADIVKNGLPTWSRVNAELRTALRSIPFGNFIGFHLEVIRTRVQMGVLAKNEITEGREMTARGKKTANLELQQQGERLTRIGATRAVSIGVVPLMYSGVAMLSKMLYGIGDDEEDDLRRGFAPWERYSPKWYLGSPEKGKVKFIDLGAVNPFGILQKPITAAMVNLSEGPEKAFREGVAEFLAPFTDTDFMIGLAFDLATGREHEGGISDIIRGERPHETSVIWNPDDPNNSARIAQRFLQEASLLNFGKRLQRARDEEVSQSGIATTPGQELLGQFTRFRVSHRDWVQTLQNRAPYEYVKDLSEAKGFFTKPANRRGKPNEKQILRGFHGYAAQTLERQREVFLDIRAARRAGATEDEIFDALTVDNGLGKERAELLMGATLTLEIPSTTHGDLLMDDLESIATDVVAAYEKKYKDEGLVIERR